MSKFLVYIRTGCRFSEQARQLLDSKGLEYFEKDVTHDVLLKREMIELSGGRVTTPQVFFKGRHIGGCDELCKLDGSLGLENVTFETFIKKAS